MVSTMVDTEQVKIPKGYKQTEVGVIPEDWEEVKVQDVCGFIVPGRNKPLRFDGDIPWITTPDLTDGRVVYQSGHELKISKEEAKSVGSKIVPPGAVIMSCVGELGLVAIAGCSMVLNQQLHAFLPTSKISNFYLAYALKTQENYFYSAATKTALPYLNKDNCNATPIALPPLKEQTAIANALSDVDNLIAALETLIAKKSAIKTAAMQQLLTGKKRLPAFAGEREGQHLKANEQCNAKPNEKHRTQPNSASDTPAQHHSDAENNHHQHTPRPGYKHTELGEIPEDWEVAPMSELTTLMTNGFVGTAKTHYTEESDGVLYIQGYNVKENSFNFRGIKKVTKEFHLRQSKSCLREGDILMVQTGDVGLTTIVPKELIGSNCHALIISRFKLQRFSPLYYSYYLNSSDGRNRLKDLEVGTTMKHINVGDLLDFLVPVPLLREEQTAIANVLSDMDAELDALQQRLSKTKTIKQGMMQELLTGKTRLV